MKKSKFLISFILVSILFAFVTLSYATNTTLGNGYEFSLNYSGEIIKNEDKSGTVILAGTNANPYSNVRIKVDLISGPAVPTVLAYDSTGVGYNIMELGYWGPPSGFAVGGTFSNETPVVATYPEAGTYVIQLALIDLNNNDAVITAKEFTQVVSETASITNNTLDNIVNNTIEEIPQAGISIWTYILTIVIVIALLAIGRKFLIKK